MTPTAEKVRGCLVGFCLADALAQVARAFTPALAQEFVDRLLGPWFEGRMLEELPEAFQITDGAQLACELLRSIDDQGVFQLARFTGGLRQLVTTGRISSRYWETHLAFKKLKQNANHPQTGSPSRGAGSLHRAPMVGLAYWHNGAARQRVARRQCRVTHTDGMCLAACTTIAELVASLLQAPEGDREQKLALNLADDNQDFQRTIEGLGPLLALDAPAALARIHELASPAAPQDSFDGLQDDIGAAFSWSMYCVARNNWDYRRAVSLAVGCGGEVVAPAAIAGALCGAQCGLQGLPNTLMDRLTDRGVMNLAEFVELADRCLDVSLRSTMRRASAD